MKGTIVIHFNSVKPYHNIIPLPPLTHNFKLSPFFVSTCYLFKYLLFWWCIQENCICIYLIYYDDKCIHILFWRVEAKNWFEKNNPGQIYIHINLYIYRWLRLLIMYIYINLVILKYKRNYLYTKRLLWLLTINYIYILILLFLYILKGNFGFWLLNLYFI